MAIKFLKKKNYLAMIENSASGENRMFRNLYIETDGVVKDLLEDGKNSCAVFVSSILVLLDNLFHWIQGLHATVISTEDDMTKSGWYETKDLKSGAILVWEKKLGHDGKMHKHIGFYIDKNMAISNDSRGTGIPHKHHYTYNDTRKIEKIYWHAQLDD